MPSSKASLLLHNDISEHTLLGLSDYSHVWILFHFHKNRVSTTNTKSMTKKQRMGILQRKRPPFKAKINPPKLKNGAKVGVFSARLVASSFSVVVVVPSSTSFVSCAPS